MYLLIYLHIKFMVAFSESVNIQRVMITDCSTTDITKMSSYILVNTA